MVVTKSIGRYFEIENAIMQLYYTLMRSKLEDVTIVWDPLYQNQTNQVVFSPESNGVCINILRTCLAVAALVVKLNVVLVGNLSVKVLVKSKVLRTSP